MKFTNWQIQVYVQQGGIINHGSPGFGFAANSDTFDYKAVQKCDDSLLTLILMEWPDLFLRPSKQEIIDADLETDQDLQQKLASAVMAYVAAEKAMGYSKPKNESFAGAWRVDVQPRSRPPHNAVMAKEVFASFGITFIRLKLESPYEIQLVENR